MELNPVKTFYDELSADYHLNFGNWDEAIANQAKILDKIIKEYANGSAQTLLDCSCGIGTQAIGLAQMGYTVTASDLSPLAIKRAEEEALKRNVSIHFKVADFLRIENEIEDIFDVVISCDNSLPHLLSDAELQLAAKNILSKIKPGGLFIASTRDYDELLKNKPISTYPIISDIDGAKTFTFQTWEWLENNIYTLNHYVIKGAPDNFTTGLRKVQYRAYQRNEMDAIFKNAGFTGIKWLMPEESEYYQPVMVAFKA
ncbi:class I SAM-dependent DNA methyltransferase [Mucilaginibacter sp. McL0603]|uniref:class I SAM-dependent DNA methyltransferase n=1 Tax=Mucilaginibacter sp. McL0603 TaxID=3415670 RepID=UPI003CF05F25